MLLSIQTNYCYFLYKPWSLLITASQRVFLTRFWTRFVTTFFWWVSRKLTRKSIWKRHPAWPEKKNIKIHLSNKAPQKKTWVFILFSGEFPGNSPEKKCYKTCPKSGEKDLFITISRTIKINKMFSIQSICRTKFFSIIFWWVSWKLAGKILKCYCNVEVIFKTHRKTNGCMCCGVVSLLETRRKIVLENSPENCVGKLTGNFCWKTHRKILLNSPENSVGTIHWIVLLENFVRTLTRNLCWGTLET